MKSSKLIEIFEDGNLVIPMYLLKNYKKLKLELDEFIFLMYLYNQGNHFLFNPNLFAEQVNLDLSDIMELTNSLTDKGFISVDVSKNDKGIMEDVVALDDFYQKLKLIVIEDINIDESRKKDESTIYEVIEKEFGRTLSSIEYEIIRAWLEHNYSEELIKEALKEAVLNGVSNLKYIDKILFEWSKKGIKTINDVEENRKKHRNLNSSNKDINDNIDMDIVDWNWFDDE